MKANRLRISRVIQISVILTVLIFAVSKTYAQTNPVTQRQAQNALWDAAQSGDLEALIEAEKDGADVDALDLRISENGRGALNWAAWFNHTDALKELLDMGADIDGVNLTGFTPIHHAAENGSMDAARLLIEAGADIDLASYDGETPLQRAKKEGHQEIVLLLEDVGASE